ncbi:MAG: pyridoxal-phosphate dependent enzyme [Ardenticatenaceae bacterium]|nr:pyridoxal-phosphate dependent enzyme [Ardenticatenaceae bacterium]
MKTMTPALKTKQKDIGMQCRACGAITDYDGPLPACPTCQQGWLDAVYDLAETADIWSQELRQREATLWRYHELLPIQNLDHVVSFGEGWTPLIRARNLGLMLGHPNIYIKDERQGPTGSFKDRQAAIAVSAMKEAGITEAVVASTGNVAIAYSAYCARAGIKLWAFVTSSVPPEKMREAAIYGTEIIKVAGTYDEAKKIAAEFAANRNIFLDRGIKAIAAKEAMKTVAFELAEQLGRIEHQKNPMNTFEVTPFASPDWFLQAVSGGMGPVGVMKGFAELEAMGMVDKRPKLGCFQVSGCAPMAIAFEKGLSTPENVMQPVTDIATLATGIPGQAYEVLVELIDQYGGTIRSVSDAEAFRALKVLAQMDGFSVEPATAVTFAGLINLIREGVIKPEETVVVNCSGHTFPVEKHILGDSFAREMNSTYHAHEDGLLTALEKLDGRIRRIAILEDNLDAARLIRRILQAQGEFYIDEAQNGREGLELIRKNQPNLIILDLMMPEMDGFAVVEALKSDPKLRDIPIIVITAKELSPIEHRRLNGKIKRLLPKGDFMDADLIKDIARVLK